MRNRRFMAAPRLQAAPRVASPLPRAPGEAVARGNGMPTSGLLQRLLDLLPRDRLDVAGDAFVLTVPSPRLREARGTRRARIQRQLAAFAGQDERAGIDLVEEDAMNHARLRAGEIVRDVPPERLVL